MKTHWRALNSPHCFAVKCTCMWEVNNVGAQKSTQRKSKRIHNYLVHRQGVKVFFSKVVVVILISFVKFKIPVDLLMWSFAGCDSWIFNFCWETNQITESHYNSCQNSVETEWSISRKLNGNRTKVFMLLFPVVWRISHCAPNAPKKKKIGLFSLILNHKSSKIERIVRIVRCT